MYKLHLIENKTATKWLQRELKETMEGKEHYICKDYHKLSFPTATEGVWAKAVVLSVQPILFCPVVLAITAFLFQYGL